MQTVELIRLRLLSVSHTFDELEDFMRRRRPRVMTDAIGVLLLKLRHQGKVRIINGRWETCRPIILSLGPALRQPNVGICEECGSERHDMATCPQVKRSMESPYPEEEAA